MPAKDPLPLADLPVGASCIVRALSCQRGLARRLMEMGLLPGTAVTVTRVAPLGDPVQLRVRDYALSIRRTEANAIQVTQTHRPAPALASVASYPVG